MELRVLNYFVEIVNQHGMTKAANHLHVSQSTLSRQIQDLEQELGTQLFVRGPRNISLTEDGYFLYSRAQEILSLSDGTKNYLVQGKSLAGELNIGAGENDANQYLLPSFKRLIDTGNGVRINYESLDGDQIMTGIDRGSLDFGVIATNQSFNDYNTLTLPFEDHWGIAFPANHPFDQRNEIVAADLRHQKLLIPRQLDSSSQLLAYLDEYVDDYKIVATYDMHYNMRAMVTNRLGLALTFDKPIYQSGNIHFKRLQYLQPIRSMLIWRKDHQLTRLGSAFIEEVRETVEKDRDTPKRSN
ncbi:LysR family transcriptional regulator [Lactiplantibacillus pentosus]|uniref:LysR family transcriptional regulator n=1 Tax=Lactiplantibacillus pentosus TaxID=1589 RepID=A0AAW8VZL8_LACPE|nr:LysR family transcriptional regulator [Lactiplantibacillus pentosus]AUI79486.1 LysR family transcriptional regulator [Lactiplantibacillus pentosus]MBU7473404.1 LysR family transcriptional regulator [Lactiplantibacillus pentosus]MBU7528664.1 LysR family transcriptional regulator [Lactiplantibacillus pentosus]MCA1343463.1 LysR family transcriptional regulator [Lactiplantibacillus pentosus]MCE6030644.1 LysR family transcriptional regulator [Lactiplantibacillus pentosus]